LQQAVGVVRPCTKQQVCDSLFVGYAGPTDGPEKIATLKKYRVRRSAIRRALLWLIAHNPLYRDIRVDEDRIAVALREEDFDTSLPSANVAHDTDDWRIDSIVTSGEGYAGPRHDGDGEAESPPTNPPVVSVTMKGNILLR